MIKHNPYAASPHTLEPTPTPTPPEGPTGLKGWLILLGIYIHIGFLGNLLLLKRHTDQLIEFIHYNGMQYKILLKFNTGANFLHIFIFYSLIFLFFIKNKLFKKLLIVSLTIIPIITIINIYLGTRVYPLNITDTTWRVIKVFAISATWVFYILKSRRVANTFVRHSNPIHFTLWLVGLLILIAYVFYICHLRTIL